MSVWIKQEQGVADAEQNFNNEGDDAVPGVIRVKKELNSDIDNIKQEPTDFITQNESNLTSTLTEIKREVNDSNPNTTVCEVYIKCEPLDNSDNFEEGSHPSNSQHDDIDIKEHFPLDNNGIFYNHIEIPVEFDEAKTSVFNVSTKASTNEVQTITSGKTKKTNAQKCREYRERTKLRIAMLQNITAERSNERSETNQLQVKKPKTNAERRKKHYEAQKLKKQKIKKIPKTVKQKNKEYYERKKKLKALNALNHHSYA